MLVQREVLARKWKGAACTLNGQPARVCVQENGFARVVDLRTGLGAEWSWQAVESVMLNKTGSFSSL